MTLHACIFSSDPSQFLVFWCFSSAVGNQASGWTYQNALSDQATSAAFLMPALVTSVGFVWFCDIAVRLAA